MIFRILFERYGLILVLVYCCGLFTPYLAPKVELLDLDIGAMSDIKSGTNMLKQLFWSSVFIIYIYLLYSNLRDYRYVYLLKRIAIPFFVFNLTILIFLLSSSWADFPKLSLKRTVFQFLIIFSVTQAFLFSFKTDTLVLTFKVVNILIILMVLFTLLLGVAVNPYFELAGYSKSKNTMGAILASVFILSHITFLYYGVVIKLRVYLILVFILLCLSFSKTSIFLVVLYLLLNTLPKRFVSCLFVSSFLFLLSVFILLPVMTFYVFEYWHIGNVVAPEFLTGRGVIWESIYYDLAFFKKIITGYGYGSYFATPIQPYFFDVQHSFLQYINSSHNGYIELLAQLGIFSVFVLVILCFITLMSRHISTVSASMFFLYYNITEPAFFRDQHIVWVFTIIISIMIFLFYDFNVKKGGYSVNKDFSY
ncbi:O-antigen ligase family protein [Shewanella gaetbuli]